MQTSQDDKILRIDRGRSTVEIKFMTKLPKPKTVDLKNVFYEYNICRDIIVSRRRYLATILNFYDSLENKLYGDR